MSFSSLSLMQSRKFLPLFITQFLGALNDNFFKNALVILILYDIALTEGSDGQILITVAAGVFVLPFFLFSALAGQLADKFEKSRQIRLIKVFEILVMCLGVLALASKSSTFLIGVLFLMGTQSSFFGPLKYGILPQHLQEHQLIAGNGLVEAGTFLAILIGTIAGGLLILGDNGTPIVSAFVLAIAFLGLAAAWFIPTADSMDPTLEVNTNVLGETITLVSEAKSNRPVFLSILGISWFWLVGAMFIAEFPAYASSVFGADETVVTLFLVTFSIGIAVGSVLCNRLLSGEISAKYVPLAAVFMTLFIVDLSIVSGSFASEEVVDEVIGVAGFLAVDGTWRILFDMAAIAICGGVYVVPLYAILQTRSEKHRRSRTIATNNILNAAFMAAGMGFVALMLAVGFDVVDVFLTIGLLNALVAVYICGLLPQELMRSVLTWIFKTLYRVEVTGLENIHKAGERAIIIGNHSSLLDGPLLATFLPGRPMFAINTYVAQKWWVKFFLQFVDAFPLDPTNPMAIKALIREVQKDRHCVIFPEGRLTVTGALMKVFEGPGLVADKSESMVVPVRIDGAQYTRFGRLAGKLRQRWFPKITITILEPHSFSLPQEVFGRRRRQIAGTRLYDVMSDLIFNTCNTEQTLFEALLDAKSIHGGNHKILEDMDRKPLTYKGLVLGSMVLGRALAKRTKKGEYVGVLLPNVLGVGVTFFGLQAFGRVPAMLNFSTGLANIKYACTAANIRTILTSRRFVEMARLTDTVDALSEDITIIYLEDVRQRLSVIDKLAGLVLCRLPGLALPKADRKPNDPAVVLFTSGSEGVPKGVVLSHRNLLANRYQLAARIDFNASDTVFNALPVFHSFGLTGGTLLPLFSGVKVFLYPSPLHYRIVPALVYDSNATIMFGTDTFLSGYARVAHPYDFYSVRYIFAGAEKVREETRRVWSEKFGIRLLEGYGTTETSPVLAANTPMHVKAGTVGRFLPSIEHRLDPVPGIKDGGRLVVKGPNVMLGYLKVDDPGVIQPPENGWYDTGDIVDVDEDGFVCIIGRAKRFAKVAGEMVSLTAVEGSASRLWPNNQHAAIALPDERKGEQIILMTDRSDADKSELQVWARDNGVAEILVPKEIRVLDELPVLGTGKIDYVALQDAVHPSRLHSNPL